MIEAVLKLDLGPDTAATLHRISAYLDALEAPASDGGDAADEAAAGKRADGVAKCRDAIRALEADGLVALGLSAAQYRVLGALREAALALKGGEADALTYERAVGALRQAAGQLGEIGAAVQVKVADTEDAGLRAVLQAQKERAVDLYQRLQVRLAVVVEGSWGPGLAGRPRGRLEGSLL